MRITGGTLKSRKLEVPKNLKARPTTDFAREGIMNSLESRLSFSEVKLLDLFAGTGAISLEFLSRGALSSLAIDIQFNHIKFIKKNASQHQVNLTAYKADVLKWLKKPQELKFNCIFADPPYAISELPELPNMILNSGLLEEKGIIIIEHGKEHSFEEHPNFVYAKRYGNVNFSIFE